MYRLRPHLTRAERSVMEPRHPARTLVALFVSLIVVGGILLRLPISHHGEVSWIDAYFTATSAVCVTGLVVTDTATTFTPFGQAVILLLIQVGGLGYMTASTFLFLLFRREPVLHERLLLRDTLGHVTLSDTKGLVFRAVRFTLIAETAGALILIARFAAEPGRTPGEAVWLGVFHSVSAFCNAGFDLFGRYGQSSLEAYRGDWTVSLVVAALIIVGGLGFGVYQELVRRRRNRPLSLHTRLVLHVTFWLITVATAAVLAAEWTNPRTLAPLPWHEKLLASFFQSVTLRTAGFSTLDFGDFRPITLLIGGLFMVIGASPGGTGGGIKTTTFAVILTTVIASLRCRDDVELFNRRIPPEMVYRALVIIVLSFAVLVLGMFTLTFTEPESPFEPVMRQHLFVRIQFEALSAFATVGLSTGITPDLSAVGRLVLIALMFIGRLGPTTVATAWAAPGPPPKRRMPEERVALG